MLHYYLSVGGADAINCLGHDMSKLTAKDFDTFIDNMMSRGKRVYLERGHVAIAPTEGIGLSDLIEMQRLNKNGGLANHIANKGE